MNKAIVLVSGGLDSLVTACVASRENDEIYFLHLNYGQRTEERELTAFQKICDYFKPNDQKVINIGYLKEFGGSSLIDKNIDIPINTEPFEVPNTYVPFRNGNMIAIACSWAEVLNTKLPISQKCSYLQSDICQSKSLSGNDYCIYTKKDFCHDNILKIYIGATEIEGSNYPDCRRDFFQSFEKAIDYGTRNNLKVKICTPLNSYSKADIVKLGKKMNIPFEYSWSCYSENDIACGQCDSCLIRMRAFEKAGLHDPIPYRK